MAIELGHLALLPIRRTPVDLNRANQSQAMVDEINRWLDNNPDYLGLLRKIAPKERVVHFEVILTLSGFWWRVFNHPDGRGWSLAFARRVDCTRAAFHAFIDGYEKPTKKKFKL